MSLTTDHLSTRGVAFEVIPHEKAFTSIDEARALGIEADDVSRLVVAPLAGSSWLFFSPQPKNAAASIKRKTNFLYSML